MKTDWKTRQLVTLMIVFVSFPAFAADLPDGKLNGIDFLQDKFALRGREARHQLVVTGAYGAKDLRDLTRDVKYSVTPANIVSVSDAGLVSPLADGKANVIASYSNGHKTTATITVEHFENPSPINFPNQIVPIFAKLGCNSGACHGKASGQNGFRLSLLGFEPPEDYEFLTREGRGRRLFPAAPDRSLLLLKATGAIPHAGGMQLDPESHSYRTIRRWIALGMPYSGKDDPVVKGIEVVPPHRIMPREGMQQVCVLAHYSDGTVEDVTHTAKYEANDKEMAETDETGLVRATSLAGDIAVMVRYSGHVATFRATVPLGVEGLDLPEPANLVDTHVFNKLKLLGMPPSEISDDVTFLRRSALDIAGRLPTLEETKAFVADTSGGKRAKWIDYLLESTDYADYFANKWSSILRNKRRKDTYKHGTFAFHEWIRQSFHQNKPYDKFVREIIAASGDPSTHPPSVWYREVTKGQEQMEDVSQLFLGVRIQCAQCHHHPYEKWSQNDYHGFVAFFNQVGRKKVGVDEERIYHKRGVAAATNPKNNQRLKPAGLGSQPFEIPASGDPRHKLVDWMSQKDNPFFAKSLVNRYWKHFFGRGIVDPEDDMRATNPPSNPELLDALAKHFIDSGFDLKNLVRLIANSKAYQLTSMPNKYNAKDKQNFSRFYPRRLPAEVLLDAIDNLTGTKTSFSGLPSGTRAVQIPDSGANSYFLTVFGRPEASSACECERTGDASLAQSLHLLNSKDIQNKLTSGRAAKLARDKSRSDEEKINELYMIALSRMPDSNERELALAHLKKQKKIQEGFEDLVWVLMNTKEFLFNH